MTHYVAMAGMHGCIPNYCECFGIREFAVGSLVELQELDCEQKRRLERYGYLELSLRDDGNEYCEIAECNCGDPAIHGEGELFEEELDDFADNAWIRKVTP